MKINLKKVKRVQRQKRFKDIKINNTIKTDKKENISFSLTKKESKLYSNWINSLWDNIEIDDSEDVYILYPTFHFSPYEMGVMITATVESNEIILRTAWEDDEIRKKI